MTDIGLSEEGISSGRPASDDELYSRERILTVLGRVRRAGGVPLEEKTMRHTACWLRGLALRGYADGALLSDGPAAMETFRESFANPTTRAQYARAIVAYIGGLTDDEFAAEYPDTTRKAIVRLMRDITAEAGKEEKTRRRREV
jgi:hypothetical protein